MRDRIPLHRQGDDMDLPPGKTCGDCVHVQRCTAMFGHIPADEVCDWSPSRFRPTPFPPREGRQMADLSHTEKALAYFRSALEGGIPPFVPSRVRLHATVRGDMFFAATFADAGEHDCESNRYGAISVRATNGQMLGVKPAEFEVVAWRQNTQQAGRVDPSRDVTP